MKTYTYIINWEENGEIMETGYTKFTDALHAFNLIEGKATINKFDGYRFIRTVKSK